MCNDSCVMTDVCGCVRVTVTKVIDRSPLRAFCHVKKRNTDSERDSEKDWRENLCGDNFSDLHLLHLTSTRYLNHSSRSTGSIFLEVVMVKTRLSQIYCLIAHICHECLGCHI